MNRIILMVVSLFSGLALAQPEPLKKQIPIADNIGKFEVNLQFALDRPITESIRMDLNVLCKDHRTEPNSAQPQLEKLLNDEKICAFDDYKFDNATKVLTLRYSTGHFDGDLASCDEHWKQEIDLKEVCESWEGARKPANELAESDEDTDFSSSNRRRHHRGVRARHRVHGNDYYNSSFRETNPSYDTDSFFSGSLVGSYPQQRGDYIGRDGLPRNGRREVNRCPGLERAGVSSCMSAIMAAESSCSTTVHHSGHGIGLCAINNDGKRFQYGREECSDIRSTQGQIRCCNAIYAKVGMRYFAARTRRIARAACGI